MIGHAKLGAILIVASWCAAAGVSGARAEHRVALVIGNAAYPGAELTSPPNDVRAVRKALEGRGFVVTEILDADTKSLQAAVEKFVHSVPTRGTALAYFSGYALHGGQGFYSDNFLLPIDGNGTNIGTVPQGKVGVRWLLDQLHKLSGSDRSILLIDGSYAHPKQAKQQDFTLRAIERFPDESLAIYAAPFGKVVVPSTSGLSPFASLLTEQLGSEKSLADVLKAIGTTRESSLESLDVLTAEPSTAIALASELKPGTNAGDEWVNEWGMVFCWCPAGTGKLGSPTTEPGRDDEEALRDVKGDRGFWVAKYEFTRREIMTLMKRHTYLSTGTHKLQPLDKTRNDDVGQWLTILNGNVAADWSYAVPKEEEWEYAARAGTTTAFFFGDDSRELFKHGNFADRSLHDTDTGYYAYADRSLSDGSALIAKVGSYQPNPWGLCDVHGNLSEHCDTPYTAANVKPSTYPNHVIRGGSWLSNPSSCRSAARNYFSFGASENVVPNHAGYRLVIRQK